MITANGLLSKSSKKHVLQQSNSNFDTSNDKEEDYKVLEKKLPMIKNKDGMSLETENQCNSPKIIEKNVKLDAKKLRSIRLELSSLRRCVAEKVNTSSKSSINEFSSDESSEDESRKNRKSRPVLPNYVTNSEGGPNRKPRQSRQDSLLVSSQTSSKFSKSQPLSIARRNARERNRVKQVNEGFATLRSRIPEYISEAYNEEKGRKSAKKLSKVETLRMAVDYIRHLETLLDLKSTEIKQIKTENQPWSPPSSSVDCPSPVDSKYQPLCMESPGTSYEHTFEYQDRIFYDYDLDFMSRKESSSPDKRPEGLALSGNENENQCVENFKYYETFNRLKKESSEIVHDENDAEEPDNLENVDNSHREPEMLLLPKPTNVIKKVLKKSTVLPSITESFNKGITVFF